MKTKEEWFDKMCDAFDIEFDYEGQQLMLKFIDEIKLDAYKEGETVGTLKLNQI